MKKEMTAVGKTVEAAVSSGARELGVSVDRITYEILESPKKGFLGFGEAPAKVKVTYIPGPADTAVEFVRAITEGMELDAEVELVRELTPAGDRLIRVTGEKAGALIGHHGETMDALQCLANLAANRREEGEEGRGYTRIAVDIENYRSKREETLRRLARSMASRVLKYKKSVMLEPMNPYERRIIHSEVQEIKGVTTKSVGTENNRRVVINLAGETGRGYSSARNFNEGNPGADAGTAGNAFPGGSGRRRPAGTRPPLPPKAPTE